MTNGSDNPIIRVINNGRVTPTEKYEALKLLQADTDAFLASRLERLNDKPKLVEMADTVEKAAELVLTGDEIRGLSTGYSDLDKMTRGINPSEIVIFFADTGVGKSQVLQNIALNVAKAGTPLLFIGLEMSNEENTARLLAMDSELSDLPIWYPHPEADLGFQHIAALVEAAKEKGAELTIIDHLHMFQTGVSNRADGLEQVCAEMKRIARLYQMPLLITAQTNRGSDGRGIPELRDIRGSVAVEQIADIAMALWKDPELEPKDAPLQVVVRKQRKGWRKVKTELHSDENARLKQLTFMDIMPGAEVVQTPKPPGFSY